MKRIAMVFMVLIPVLFIGAGVSAETGLIFSAAFQFESGHNLAWEFGGYQLVKTTGVGPIYAIGQGAYGQDLAGPGYKSSVEGGFVVVFKGPGRKGLSPALQISSGYNWSGGDLTISDYVKNAIGGGVEFTNGKGWAAYALGRLIPKFGDKATYDAKIFLTFKVF